MVCRGPGLQGARRRRLIPLISTKRLKCLPVPAKAGRLGRWGNSIGFDGIDGRLSGAGSARRGGSVPARARPPQFHVCVSASTKSNPRSLAGFWPIQLSARCGLDGRQMTRRADLARRCPTFAAHQLAVKRHHSGRPSSLLEQHHERMAGENGCVVAHEAMGIQVRIALCIID